MIDFIKMTPDQRFEAAKKDDICDNLDASDIRSLLGEIHQHKQFNTIKEGIFNTKKFEFANSALNGMLQNPNSKMDAGEICIAAWAYADMMMEMHEENY